MAGRLLLVVLMYYLSGVKAQALLPPKLRVSPAVITETESVTLNCQTPSSPSLSNCYFRFVRGEPAKVLSCLKNLTGSELLKMSHQSSPAEVKVTCFYLHGSQSPDSDTSSIIIRTSHPPKLTVNPAVITETESVTLNCRPPSSVSVSQCYFYTFSGQTVGDLSCLQTLTGTELLKMSHQRSSAEVQVVCFYTVKLGERNYPSPYSETSSITIHSQTPRMNLKHLLGEYVLFTCSLPGSANHNTRCNLYLGEESRPAVTAIIERKSHNQWFCQFTVTIDDLLRRLHLVLRKDASCDYNLGSGPNSLSPRSDGYSLTDIVEKESSNTPTTSTFSTTTSLTVTTLVTTVKQTARTVKPSSTVSSTSSTSTSTSLTSVKPASETDTSLTPVNPESSKEKKETWIWKSAAVVAGCGVTVGIVLLVSAALSNKRRTGSEEVKRESEDENFEVYHLYATATEPPAASDLCAMYSTVQKT